MGHKVRRKDGLRGKIERIQGHSIQSYRFIKHNKNKNIKFRKRMFHTDTMGVNSALFVVHWLLFGAGTVFAE